MTWKKTGRYGAAGHLGDPLGTQATRELEEDTIARRRRVLGEDHPDTLRSAASLQALQGDPDDHAG